MKNVKKIIAILCVSAMVVGTMVACGSNKPANKEEPEPTKIVESSTNDVSNDKQNEKKEDITLKWYFLGDTTRVGNEEVFDLASDMVYEKLGFHVDFMPIDYSSYNDKIQMIIAGGEDYDICWTSNWKNDYATNVANGAFLKLDDLLDEVPALKESMTEGIWNGTIVNGGIYGVPVQQIMARSACLRIPEVLYEKYEATLEGVDSFVELGDFMAAYGADYPDTGKVSFNWGNLSYSYGIEEPLGTLIPGAVMYEGPEDEITVFNQFATDEFRDLVMTRREWTEKGYTLKGSDGDNGGVSPESTPEGMPVAVDAYKPGFEAELSASLGYPVKAIRISDPYLSAGGVQATMHAINAQSKHPIEALQFLEYVNTDSEIANLLVYGIEGKHYVKLDENTVKRVENTEYSNESWIIGNVFNTYLVEGQADDAWTQTKEINDTAKQSRLMGFAVDTEPIKLQIANCKSVIDEYIGRLDEGTGDSAVLLDEMLKKLEAAGVNDIIEGLQSQIDAWLTTK